MICCTLLNSRHVKTKGESKGRQEGMYSTRYPPETFYQYIPVCYLCLKGISPLLGSCCFRHPVVCLRWKSTPYFTYRLVASYEVPGTRYLLSTKNPCIQTSVICHTSIHYITSTYYQARRLYWYPTWYWYHRNGGPPCLVCSTTRRYWSTRIFMVLWWMLEISTYYQVPVVPGTWVQKYKS